ncbi:hypothetical protein JCM5353_007102 [Sporobolomyces roseus]
MCCRRESEITQSFDLICYRKGCAVLKMLISMIGESQFLRATSDYLQANQHGCSTSKDLWESLSKVSGIDVEYLLDSWINKVGFPVVTVEEMDDKLKLRQTRFLAAGDLQPEEDETIWTIPLTITSLDSTKQTERIMMSTRESTIARPGGLYFVNVGTVGTYRVAYPASHLPQLAAEANKPNSTLSLADRIGLVQDAIVLSEAGYLNTSTVFSLFKQFRNEREFLVWSEIADAFRRILDTWWEQPEDVLDALRSFARSLFAPLVKKLGLEHQESDPSTKRRFRTMVTAASAAAEVPETLQWIKSSFGAMLTGQMSPSAADSALAIVSSSVRHGSDREYRIILQIYSNPPTPQHKTAAIAGLTGSKDVRLLRQTALMLTSGAVAQEDMSKFLYGLANNPQSRRLVWGFVQQAWPMLEQQFRGSMLLGRIAAASFESFTSDVDADAVEAFFAEKGTSAFQQPLDQGIESVRSKARWLSRETQNVSTWLESEGFLVRTGAEEVGVAQG